MVNVKYHGQRGSSFIRNLNSSKRPCYPNKLVQSTIRKFVDSKVPEVPRTQHEVLEKKEAPITIVPPFKNKRSANAVRRQLGNISQKMDVDISPVYRSRKIKDEIKVEEHKPPLVNQQYVHACTIFSVTCMMCVMSLTRPDTFTSELKNTRDR